MILSGNNLGERHRDLNSKVSEAVATQTDFEELRLLPEKSDVDVLFKIDVASKYKNVDYILEVLKRGDVFHITRTLKCLWLYTDQYSQFINTEYLKTNIFPHMSRKMKKKMLTSIAIHMRNSERAIDFHKYCIKDRLNDYAVKFLFYTPDSYKLQLLKTGNASGLKHSKHLKHYIGSSFELALAYYEICNSTSHTILELRFLYSVSEESYLDILERIQNNAASPQCPRRFGLRISNNILNKHKQRVFDKPLLYVNILNKSMLVKHLTSGDVESIVPSLLPQSSSYYWRLDFYNTYNFILEKIPASKLFGYMKDIYTLKYKDSTFEMRMEFYDLKYYEWFNIDEREAWALQHIEQDKERDVKNYIWYKFVSFPKAFPGIKRHIFLTSDKSERSQIVNILPETARSQEDINEILKYYYDRHVNESEEDKESFLDQVDEVQDIYSFNNDCWTSFDKLLHSLGIYGTDVCTRHEYKIRSMIYHVLHDKELPEPIETCIRSVCSFYYYKPLIKKLSEERKDVVAKFLLNYFGKEMDTLMNQCEDVKIVDGINISTGVKEYEIQEIVCKIWSVVYTFERPFDYCPEIVVQYMESNMNIYGSHEKYKIIFLKRSDDDFVSWLKQDKEMSVDGIYEIRCNSYRWDFKLCRLFRKLKVYFPNDVAKEYLDYFLNYLSDIPEGCREYRNIKMAIVGVFYLEDQESIIRLLQKYVPQTPKIDHINRDNTVFQVQKAICRLIYYPRPPLPLSIIQKFITGDYVHYCIPLFDNYFANLPCNKKFIKSLLDCPLSIQKYGLRFAITDYSAEILKPIIESAWRKTQNVSLRMLLYEKLFNRIVNECEEVQKKLYEVLKLYTSEIDHNDHKNVYSLLVSNDIPDMVKGDFIETAWLTVSKLPDKSVHVAHKISVIKHMEKYIHLVQRDFPYVHIIKDHIDKMLFEKSINDDFEDHFEKLNNAKWDLIAKYVMNFKNKVEQRKSLQLIETIMTEILESWNLINKQTFTVRKFLQRFIRIIMGKDPKTIQSCAQIVCIYQCILDKLQSLYNNEETYLMNWELKLSIASRNIIKNKIKSYAFYKKPTNISGEVIAYEFGKEVAKMVMSSVRNREFYCSFYQSIANTVNEVGCTVCDILSIGHSGFIYYVCDSLTDTKMAETHLLALFMLPKYPDSDMASRHSKTITKLQKFGNREVQSSLYQKFAFSDFQAAPEEIKITSKKFTFSKIKFSLLFIMISMIICYYFIMLLK